MKDMAHDRQLLKLEEIPLFMAYLSQTQVEWRAGKGEYQLMQVKRGNDWLAVCRNKQDVVTTPPALRDIISVFDQWAGWLSSNERKSASTAPPQAKQSQPVDSDLRDDFAIAALSMLSHRLGSKIQDRTWTAEAVAAASYELADAMMVVRDWRHPPRKSAEWPAEWKAKGYNQCMDTAQAALRFLANNNLPIGGEERYNLAHLHQIADELETTKRELLP
jgi:hypothetical protein